VSIVAWEAGENVAVAPLVWGRMPEPGREVRTPTSVVRTVGAAVVGADGDRVTLRAWSPTPQVRVDPGGAPPTVRLTNVPRRARWWASAGVRQEVDGSALLFRGPEDRPWAVSAAAGGRPCSFAVLGDTGASPTFAAALRRAADLGADFFVVVGDLLYHDAEVAPLLALLEASPLPVYFVRGNHDYASRARREALGRLAPAFYAFEWCEASFVMLDNGLERLPRTGAWSDQYEWLERTLLEPHGAPRFVFLHKSPLASPDERPWHAMWDRDYARRLARSFEEAGVHAVFAGHRHVHERRETGGVLYVTVGEGRAGRSRGPVMAVVRMTTADPDVEFVPVWADGALPRGAGPAFSG
jgi:3',5'-cyclic AMP phosphodiesterase CpdA